MNYLSSDFVSDEYLHINSCDRQYLYGRDCGSVRPRGRHDWHILYIQKGICFVNRKIGDEESEIGVPAGSIIIYKPHERQDYKFKADVETVSYYVHFSGTGCSEIIGALKLDRRMIYTVGSDKNTESAFLKMIEEHHMQKPFCESLCAGYMLQILSLAARYAEYGSTESARETGNLISKVCDKMYHELDQNKSVSEYAAFCNMSTSRFTHIFKSALGISPKRYIINLKMTKAVELLENTYLSVNETARRVGIEDQNYFSRLFKKHTGVSPKKFKAD